MSLDEELIRQLEAVRQGGRPEYHAKLGAEDKLFVRERLHRLLEPDSMVEEGALARCADDGLAADAVVTVTGKIGDRSVCVMANDMTVKAGAWGRLTIQKIQRIQEIARDAEIPMLYLGDSAGARPAEQFDIFVNRTHAGRIFHNQILLSGVVPQICVLFGPSPAGSAYIPAFCDLVIMVDGHASAYLGSPRMSEMATGEKVTMEERGADALQRERARRRAGGRRGGGAGRPHAAPLLHATLLARGDSARGGAPAGRRQAHRRADPARAEPRLRHAASHRQARGRGVVLRDQAAVRAGAHHRARPPRRPGDRGPRQSAQAEGA